MKIPRVYSEAVNQKRTDNIMTKTKRTNNDLQNTTQKISSDTNPTKTVVNSGALERYRMWPKILAHLKQNFYVINQNYIFERIQNRPPLWLTIGLGNRSSGYICKIVRIRQ